MRFAFALVAALGFAASASAQVTGLPVVQYSDNGGADALAGTVTSDLFIDFTGNLGGNQILLELTSGSVYNAPAGIGGGDTSPLGVLANTNPLVRFDTFVGLGATTSDDAQGSIMYLGSLATGGTPTISMGSVVNGQVQFIPEPTTAILLGLATCGLATVRSRR